jgi:hypothetical protein
VFLGEDLMHTRDYSDVTSRVIDEEVERILREQESRAIRLLREHRDGLGAVANALLEKETVDGAEVGRLVDGAYGRPVHEEYTEVPHFADMVIENGHDSEATPSQAPTPAPSLPSTSWQPR